MGRAVRRTVFDVRPRPSRTDPALLGVGVAAFVVAVVASSEGTWPLIALASAPLIVRAVWRSLPVWAVLAATLVPIMIVEAIENSPTTATWLIGCIALVAGAMDRRDSIEWVPIGAVIAGPLILRLAGLNDNEAAIVAIWTMGLLLSATGGTIAGQQRRLIATLREAQTNLAAAAAAEERQHIARDLHDIVGHSFSVVLLHLAGARHLMATDPVAAEAALRQAEEVGRRSMDDLRASLALLRTNDDSYSPTGDLSALPALVDGMRTAGLDVMFSATGDLQRVDTVVGVVIHGVAREALTNAAKHAATGPVVCSVAVDDARAVLGVTNPARADSGSGIGLGLAGMRERVNAIGGSLTAGHRGGEWVVVLDVPVCSRRAVP